MLIERSFLKLALLSLFVLTGISSVSAQTQPGFILKLSDEHVSMFRDRGSLSSAIPEDVQSKIGFVELQYASNADGTAIEPEVGIVVDGDNANILLDDQTLQSLKQQPLRFSVTPSNGSFSKVVLKYDPPPVAAVEEESATTELNDSGDPVGRFFVKLTDRKNMAGDMDGFDEFKINTRFGDVSIPMDQVAGIKFHSDGGETALVVLNNGDSITGVPVISSIELKTDWGQADIEPRFIDSITTTSNAAFAQTSGDFGTRWVLRRTGSSFAPAAPGFGN